jgi:hypothetical protein
MYIAGDLCAMGYERQSHTQTVKTKGIYACTLTIKLDVPVSTFSSPETRALNMHTENTILSTITATTKGRAHCISTLATKWEQENARVEVEGSDFKGLEEDAKDVVGLRTCTLRGSTESLSCIVF